MKKMLTCSVAAAALLIPGAATAAFAGPGDNYPGTIRTETKVQGPGQSKVGKTETYDVKLRVDSNGDPCKGEFTFRVTKGKTVVKDASKRTNGSTKSFSVTFDEGKGDYDIKARFVPVDRSPCKGSHDDKTVTVKKR